MISQTNSSVARAAYQNAKLGDAKDVKPSINVSKQGDTSQIEALKESIDSGEYKVNIQALSEKIAESLL